MRKHQVDSVLVAKFVANNSDGGSTVREERSELLVEYSVFPSANSESGSFSLTRNGTNPDSPISIPSIFPAINTDSENDGSSESNETSPTFSHNSNSVVSFFPPAWSATDSPENYEIIITNPSIPLIFPPTISETETDNSCSESNESPRAQFSCSIVSLFPPARSQSDSSSSKNDEIILGQISPTPNLRIFSFTELKVATKNFRPDTVLGEGGFGQVFKGLLKDKWQSKSGNWMVIAVKKLSPESVEWQSEVNFLGRLSHPNLIRLLGYCWENRELLLIYEYMQNGSLENHLFGKWSAVQPLPWDIRLKIAIGAARGLAFLHTSDIKIIYGDFKASNILLDGSYTAKISDFGLAKLGPSASQSHVTTQAMGTYGYAALGYVPTGIISAKTFGLLVLLRPNEGEA
ncbi:putative serine/threonine-protein kinase PIX13 [Castanea sativa]|uniref:putative serine/threonine-protein kinase PIX13 n=1 Tax=Castanea sativa TaxID=21020 RepID=UPI003F652C2D